MLLLPSRMPAPSGAKGPRGPTGRPDHLRHGYPVERRTGHQYPETREQEHLGTLIQACAVVLTDCRSSSIRLNHSTSRFESAMVGDASNHTLRRLAGFRLRAAATQFAAAPHAPPGQAPQPGDGRDRA
jgi:hypothetical protein